MNRLSIMNSKKICNALFGDLSSLPESQTGNPTYIATFLAETIEKPYDPSLKIELGSVKKHRSGSLI